MSKTYPEVGAELYLHRLTGNYYADLVRTPYTVIAVDKNHVTIQEAACIFVGPRYYDTLPDRIVPNEYGEILQLNWAPKKERWQIDRYKTGYPCIAEFGQYDYYPYIN